jgi:hypothetical protein
MVSECVAYSHLDLKHSRAIWSWLILHRHFFSPVKNWSLRCSPMTIQKLENQLLTSSATETDTLCMFKQQLLTSCAQPPHLYIHHSKQKLHMHTNIITMLTSSCCRVHMMCCRITLLMSISPHNCHPSLTSPLYCTTFRIGHAVSSSITANKLNLLHDVLSCIGEQGTEALVRYINENSVENHHHYNGRSLPYSKVFIAWKSAEFLNESWKAPIDQFLVTHDSLQTSTLSQIPAMLSCCHKYARKPENRDTPVQQNQRDQLHGTCKKCNNKKKQKLKVCQNPWFPHDCVNHLQQKLPPEIEDFSLFNSSATHTICRPAQQSTHLSRSLLVEPHPLIN